MTMAGNPGIWFVVPAYNEGSSVGEVVRRVRARYPNVVVVDDGSADATAQVARDAGAVVLVHVLNRGQGAALKTGMDYALSAGADIVVTFDSDGQHRLEDVQSMIDLVAQGKCDVALGSRFLNDETQVPFMRKVTLKLGVLFTRLVSRIRVTDTHNGLRVLSRKAAAAIHIKQDRMAHASEILDEIARLKLRFIECPTQILYTDYSRGKGQRSSAAFRIVWDFLIGKSGG